MPKPSLFNSLRNSGGPPRSKLPRYHALISFADAAQLAQAMKNQADNPDMAALWLKFPGFFRPAELRIMTANP